jgi:hypothetical protein
MIHTAASQTARGIATFRKQSHNTPMEVQGREDLYLLLIHDLGTEWG